LYLWELLAGEDLVIMDTPNLGCTVVVD